MAYDIIKRLQKIGREDILDQLSAGLMAREIGKGQKHRVFEESFDAKASYSENFLIQKIGYIHHNPVSGKWNLVSDYSKYERSSASFYEDGEAKHFVPKHYKDV
ncbi:MAG: hypothetical protein JST58_02575 [Bacteroidetes bacterium]|nr:hypothetical protein [Bacteroidota bacterium]